MMWGTRIPKANSLCIHASPYDILDDIVLLVSKCISGKCIVYMFSISLVI